DLKDYYLVSVADHIIMHPLGEIHLLGIASTGFYYKGLMDKLGIGAQYISIGKYKSAGESMTRKSPSEEDKEQTWDLITDFYQNFATAITGSKKIDESQLREVIDNKPIIIAQEAVDLQLVDQIAYYDEVGKIVASWQDLQGEYPLTE